MVKIDKEKCIGCGLCPATCKEVFEMKGDKAEVKQGQENSNAECVKTAKQGCPTQAII